jgi:Tol biopolymer transport system component
LVDLNTGISRSLTEVNSNDVESYHNWSSNSRWFVFSSRRIDGLYTRPFIANIDANGKIGKPFLLPQKDPKDGWPEGLHRDVLEAAVHLDPSFLR